MQIVHYLLQGLRELREAGMDLHLRGLRSPQAGLKCGASAWHGVCAEGVHVHSLAVHALQTQSRGSQSSGQEKPEQRRGCTHASC